MEKMCKLIGKKPVEGSFGIEVEVEGNIRPLDTDYWKTEEDHSLRNGGLEYILRRPLVYEDCVKALSALYGELGRMKPIESVNAGTHIHINITTMNRLQFNNLVKLLIIAEKDILKTTSAFRKCNGFCLTFADACGIKKPLKAFLEDPSKNLQYINNDNLKYQNINFYSIARLGSIELRCFESTLDLKKILVWLDIVDSIYNLAFKLDGFKLENIPEYMKEIFGGFSSFSDYNREIYILEELFNAEDL